MNVEQLFAKDLVREINGVVKAEQVDSENEFIELDEYVVTNELNRHFRSFYEAYSPSLTDRTHKPSGKIGVWISGFFGSGKSHFLKILSYLLANRPVASDGSGRHAFDIFKNKIADPMLLADMQLAASHPADVILFNIDSRANTDDQENAILKVFLKVFNEYVGYCADFPHIAHLERELDKRGQFASFKEQFTRLTSSTWEKERDAYDFYRDELADALAHASEQSEESARAWVEQLENNFPLDIRNFCKWVNDYLELNPERNLLFMADEVGQFIGKNTQMMLKLQTIAEDLGTFCGGKAWIVVTSQADIDAAIGGMKKKEGDEFSRIQARFSTRPKLSSSNTSEVIQKRLLVKTEPAKLALAKIFEQKADILRNQLTFDKTTTASLKNYTDTQSFVDNYPFVPYHYLLVQKVFESIRSKGATGQHMAMGERSLLDAFQSAAKQYKDRDLDILIPFHSFFSSIESFLEPAVQRTIDQACEHDSLTAFDGDIFKTLFLIRYVDVLKSTLDNLVTLTIDQIDADKIVLRKQIEESLNRLERQLLISRNGDEYIFLTNEEKEIENEIRGTDVEPSELSNKLSNLIFEDVLRRTNQYRYPVNKQDFKVSRFCNGHPRDGSSLEDLVLKVTSPLDAHFDDFQQDQRCLDHTLEGDGCVLVRLADKPRLWRELSTFIQTDRFLKQNSGQRPEHEHLLREKQMENIAREKRLRIEFETLFFEADVFAIGTRLTIKANQAPAMVEEAYRYVIENTFAKLNMLQPASGEVLREISAVLMADDMAQLGIDLADEECNPQAVREAEQFISLKVERNEAVYLRDVVARFAKRPYGWPDNDILLLVARLALAGKISFTSQGTNLPLNKAYDFFTSVRKRSELRLNKIRQHDERQLKKAVSLVKELFSKTFTGTGEKELNELIRAELSHWQNELKSFRSKAQTGHFPGKQDIEDGLVLIAGVLGQGNSFSLIARLLEDGEALADLAEDFEDLDDFYNSQFSTWQDLASALHGDFKDNVVALDKEPTAAKALAELKRIYELPQPYGELRHINPLIEQVQRVNHRLVEERRVHALERIDGRISHVEKTLTEARASAELSNQALRPLQLCRQRAEKTESIPVIVSNQAEADGLEDEAFELINRHIEAQRQQQAEQERKQQAANAAASTPSSTAGVTPTLGTGATSGMSSTTQPIPECTDKQPQPYVKRTITFIPANLAPSNMIETEQQVDDYLNALRKQLMQSVNDGDRVRIK
ncbi:BREX system P-loop protein BrxC [Oceanisphaera sp. IT1-181]|uniref:BREX system P-loop protein BrxC n=1 Tax=Oceanisphaera sp. IT1-181 TaxID=3081199 RepID=UPI0029CA3249|nr:BREX system P-loop protein BrxC [Oceanisphaera sp. IT1-181]